jgi:ABC-type oligopeptide transport system ATPase subunit
VEVKDRVAIDSAIVIRPKFIVADDPVSMLDVSVRSGILKLMFRLRDA